jgi:hypothetical protein
MAAACATAIAASVVTFQWHQEALDAVTRTRWHLSPGAQDHGISTRSVVPSNPVTRPPDGIDRRVIQRALAQYYHLPRDERRDGSDADSTTRSQASTQASPPQKAHMQATQSPTLQRSTSASSSILSQISSSQGSTSSSLGDELEGLFIDPSESIGSPGRSGATNLKRPSAKRKRGTP